MPRPKSANPKEHQLLLRVTGEELRLLQAAAALRRTSPNSFVRELIERNLLTLRSDPLIRKQLELFDEFEARDSGEVVSLDNAARRGRKETAGESRSMSSGTEMLGQPTTEPAS